MAYFFVYLGVWVVEQSLVQSRMAMRLSWSPAKQEAAKS